MLNPGRAPEERLADAQVIRRNGEHLLNLINDILDLSKIEAGKMSVDRVICSPAAIIGEVAAMLQERAAKKGLSLDVTFNGEIPTTIRTDPMRLRQILINLVSNAIKFTSQGQVSVAVTITPSLRAAEPLLEIKITDTGIGIPADRIASLFEPFVQADASIARQYGGSGLGLAISRHFSRALGGDIVASSLAGQGSTFTVTVETGNLADVLIEPDPFEAMKRHDDFLGPQVRIAGKILLAEDGQDNQELIVARLRQTGLNVDVAENGQIAIDKALAAVQQERPYDLILMDVNMPVLDGYSATMNLRSQGYRAPIIALTANAMQRDREKCLNAGCNDFVTKPIHMEMLFKAIGRYLKIEHAGSGLIANSAGVNPADDAKIKEFYDNLTEQLVEIAEAIDRQDRVRLVELLKLILGKSSALKLRELAAESAKLLFCAEGGESWDALRDALNEFAKGAEPQPARQAA
jgi:CheY-like chemotaxis protein